MSSKVVMIIYLVILNIVSLGFMAYDKIRAMEHRFRIPESVLLILACVGGSLGVLLGMFLFHNRIKRLKFRYGIPAILFLQLLLYVFLVLITNRIIFL